MQSFNQNIIKHKLGLLNLATESGNVSKACKLMGLSRDTFYRYQTAVKSGGVEVLFDLNRRKPNLKNRIDLATSDWVRAYAVEQPAHGQVRASNECAKRACSCPRWECLPSGCVMIWPASNNVWLPWKSTSQQVALTYCFCEVFFKQAKLPPRPRAKPADSQAAFTAFLPGLWQACIAACRQPRGTGRHGPCESPFLPFDLIARLHDALVREQAELAESC